MPTSQRSRAEQALFRRRDATRAATERIRAAFDEARARAASDPRRSVYHLRTQDHLSRPLRLVYEVWEPERAARGTLALIHGASHASWFYWRSAPSLVAAGYRVVLLNLRGHGLDDLGSLYAGDVTQATFAHYADDIGACLDDVQQRYSLTAHDIILAGHSMGGAIATEHALRRTAYREQPLRALLWIGSPSLDAWLSVFAVRFSMFWRLLGVKGFIELLVRSSEVLFHDPDHPTNERRTRLSLLDAGTAQADVDCALYGLTPDTTHFRRFFLTYAFRKRPQAVGRVLVAHAQHRAFLRFERDAFFGARMMERSAQYYEARLLTLPGAHNAPMDARYTQAFVDAFRGLCDEVFAQENPVTAEARPGDVDRRSAP